MLVETNAATLEVKTGEDIQGSQIRRRHLRSPISDFKEDESSLKCVLGTSRINGSKRADELATHRSNIF